MNSYTHALAHEQVRKLRGLLEESELRVRAEGVDHFFCAKEQAERGGLRERTKGAGAGPGRRGVRAIRIGA